ncbi:MAG: hypothetical protein M3N47_00510 [Chloroflexota bacterium]|nr:hypothetical protein [Chloroflexota bacterium]
MDFDPRLVDPRFITVDADAQYDDILDLIGDCRRRTSSFARRRGFGISTTKKMTSSTSFDCSSLLDLDAPRATPIGQLAMT